MSYSSVAPDSYWRDCAHWLTRCKVLRADHRANWPTATAFDLAFTLRDGVLLCNLLNTVDPGCLDIKLVNQRPQMAQFLCLRNINMFLKACSSVFGLADTDLFEPSMLFELSNFHRVLRTISVLSNSPRLRRKDIPAFYVREDKSSEDIFGNFQHESATEDPVEKEDIYGIYCSQPLYEEIYQDLCSLHYPPPSQFALDDATAGGGKRNYVVQELVDTERNYVDVLSSVLRNFAKPLTSTLKPEDYKRIFFGIKGLFEIHRDFHSHLQEIRNSADVALVFIDWREKFLVYGDYCANLTHAQNCLQDICNRNELVNQEVIRCEKEANNGKFKLQDILCVPMQRVLKYHLILEQLVRETPLDDPDLRQQLEKAREVMLDVGQYINDIKRDTDTLAIIEDIQTTIVDWSHPENSQLTNFGRLHKDGELKMKAHDEQRGKARYVFIFDQAMLVCKAGRGEQYFYRGTLRLEDYTIQDNSGEGSLVRDSRWYHQWMLVHKETNRTYTLYVRTEEQKQIWIKALREALDNVKPAACQGTNHKLKLMTFDAVDYCRHCKNLLKGRFFQGYRCEYCRTSVHKQCIQYLDSCMLAPASLPWERALLAQMWFVGEMSRKDAEKNLLPCKDGTYMLRLRPAGNYQPNTNLFETRYALSIKVNGGTKHIVVYQREMDGASVFYMSTRRYFNSIIQLVEYYKRNALNENFGDSKLTRFQLMWPFERTSPRRN